MSVLQDMLRRLINCQSYCRMSDILSRLHCCCTVEIPLPNEQARMEIMKIHAAPIAKHGEIGLCILI